ncbi:MAG: NAD(P)/FAD-dependent oxidoreductase [Ilumatobacteraceae bacterium]
MSPTPSTPAVPDHLDAIVVGAGHNGLVTAAYLARSGMRTLLLEARPDVGGTAASEAFHGATVNICNCDHLTFRTTPVIDELGLGDFGLTYLDVDPGQHNLAWAGGPAWSVHHSLDATLDSLRATFPDEVEGYRRYVAAARPAVDLVFAAAADPPSAVGLTRHALRRRLAGVPTLLRWSRRSAADVMRSYFRHDALLGPGMVTGPMVWGVSPELPGTGLGALTYAMRHAGRVGRPVGGSGMVPTSLLRSFEHHGGTLLANSRVDRILCEPDHRGGAVRGVALDDGTEYAAPIVVSACDPHRTFLSWLTPPPTSARRLVDRWRDVPREQGYESKIDAVVTEPPVLRALGAAPAATAVIAPGLGEIHRGSALMDRGEVLDRPGFLANVPTLLDPSMAPTDGGHVFSLETLFTPYGLAGGWPGSTEPWRWLERFAELCEPGFLDGIVDWRAMTPDVYERDFHLPSGHATSFAGGPLAAFRNRHPELTNYETDVRGLYLTGAATFPGAGVWGASGRNCATVVLAGQ